MTTYYLVPLALYAETDWSASCFASVAPVAIITGNYAGSYAVNTAILGSDACFEKFRTLLEAQSTAELDATVFVADEESTTDADTSAQQPTDSTTSTN